MKRKSNSGKLLTKKMSIVGHFCLSLLHFCLSEQQQMILTVEHRRCASDRPFSFPDDPTETKFFNFYNKVYQFFLISFKNSPVDCHPLAW